MIQIIKDLKYLHSKDYIHRDNFLLIIFIRSLKTLNLIKFHNFLIFEFIKCLL